ncbi:DNA adenine methylase [Alistipes sp.]|uniref:DNA adenine methylase n=1 Tax=Alistipes sp. TaxID=1872444 RepID=UPI003AB4FB80
MKKPIYNSAPLPFMGQKRRFVGEFKNALRQFPTATVFVDLFGGSGLLSHIAKQEYPKVRVIYNDYEDFRLRLLNIPRTNILLADIRNFIGKSILKNGRLPKPLHKQILDRIKADEQTGFVDYITLSGSLLFSGKYATSFEEIENQSFYNTVRQADYSADGYLEGVDTVKQDYRELYDQFKDVPGAVFLVDPPYLSTEVGAYKCFWKLADYLDVLKILTGRSYIYFTSTKSQIIELIDWFTRTQFDNNPFDGAERREYNVTINHYSKYTDIMLYKQV